MVGVWYANLIEKLTDRGKMRVFINLSLSREPFFVII